MPVRFSLFLHPLTRSLPVWLGHCPHAPGQRISFCRSETCPHVQVLKLGPVAEGHVEAFAGAGRRGWPCDVIVSLEVKISTAGCERKSP